MDHLTQAAVYLGLGISSIKSFLYDKKLLDRRFSHMILEISVKKFQVTH